MTSSPSGTGGGESPIQILLKSKMQPRTLVEEQPCVGARNCDDQRPEPRKPAKLWRVKDNCDRWDYPKVVLPSGRVVIDYDARPVRNCSSMPLDN